MATGTVKTGIVTTQQVLSNELPIDMSTLVGKRQVNRGDFRTILEKLGVRTAIQAKIEWLEEDIETRTSALAASAASADTAYTVTTGEGNTVFRPYDVVRNLQTGMALLVSSVSANSIGLTKLSTDSSSAATSQTGAQLVIIGNAAAEGATSGTSLYRQRTAQYNYVQDFRTPLIMSDFQEMSSHYSGTEPGVELVRKLDRHTRDVEASLFFGERYFDNTAAAPRRTSAGAQSFITTNVTATTGGALTPSAMDTFLQAPYGVGQSTGEKALFCGPGPALVLSQMYRDKWQPVTAGADLKYGAQVTAWLHSVWGNQIPVYVKREWSDLAKTNSGDYGTWIFLIDLGLTRIAKFGPYMQLLRDRQDPSATAHAFEYRTCFSLEFKVEEAHGILKNVKTYSAT